jgi:hypothetical protein
LPSTVADAVGGAALAEELDQLHLELHHVAREHRPLHLRADRAEQVHRGIGGAPTAASSADLRTNTIVAWASASKISAAGMIAMPGKCPRRRFRSRDVLLRHDPVAGNELHHLSTMRNGWDCGSRRRTSSNVSWSD